MKKLPVVYMWLSWLRRSDTSIFLFILLRIVSFLTTQHICHGLHWRHTNRTHIPHTYVRQIQDKYVFYFIIRFIEKCFRNGICSRFFSSAKPLFVLGALCHSFVSVDVAVEPLNTTAYYVAYQIIISIQHVSLRLSIRWYFDMS